VLLQVPGVGLAFEEPQQLVQDRLEMDFLGGEQRKARIQVEAQLRAEYGKSAGAGAVALLGAVRQHMLHQVEIIAHQGSRWTMKNRFGRQRILIDIFAIRFFQDPVDDRRRGFGLLAEVAMRAECFARV
jgi:hypothetical protein